MDINHPPIPSVADMIAANNERRAQEFFKNMKKATSGGLKKSPLTQENLETIIKMSDNFCKTGRILDYDTTTYSFLDSSGNKSQHRTHKKDPRLRLHTLEFVGTNEKYTVSVIDGVAYMPCTTAIVGNRRCVLFYNELLNLTIMKHIIFYADGDLYKVPSEAFELGYRTKKDEGCLSERVLFITDLGKYAIK